MVVTRASLQTIDESSSSLKVVHVSYVDTIEGHEHMGRTIGSACQTQILRAVATDPEIKLALKIIQTVPGAKLYQQFLKKIESKYPKYLAELRGVRTGAGVPLKTLIVSCLRQVIIL